MRPRFFLPAVLLLAAVPGSAWQAAAPTPDVLASARAGGLAAIDLALAKLSTHKRLMVVGAHPDDEDNALLTWVGRGLAGEAAYLSLSRGEGGQNLIGTELGVELGIVRTGELEAARQIEGTRQYFGRAYDFGYTRSLEETLERWPREVLLEDTMRAIRRFRPQLIVAVFPGDGRAGHGQHQASGLMAREAFAAARENRPFPALDEEGLAPWAPSALYQRAWSREQATAAFDLGVLDPVSGRSLGQIASASRSQHRSQDMGREQRIGRLLGGVVWEAGAGEGGDDLFAGIDTRLEAIADPVADRERRETVAGELQRVAELAMATREGLTPARRGEATAPLATIVAGLDRALEVIDRSSPEEAAAAELIIEKRSIAVHALMAAAGVMVDATVDREKAVPGEELTVGAELWVAGSAAVESQGMFLLRPFSRELPPLEAQGTSERTGVASWSLTFELPKTTAPTMPYYLRRPRLGDLYDWRDVHPGERGEARGLPPVAVWFELVIEGVAVSFAREAVYRYGDQASGEVRRPLRVVPELEVEVSGEPILWNAGSVEEQLTVEAIVRSNGARTVKAFATLDVPWALTGGFVFQVGPSRRESKARWSFDIPEEVGPGFYEFDVGLVQRIPGTGRRAAEAAEDRRDDPPQETLALPLLEYPHIRPTPVPRRARVRLSVFDLELPALDRVGYVIGASDRVPGILEKLGVPLEILGAEDLMRGELSIYDAIVVGSRAYEIDSALAAANDRLLDYARAGGTLIVQYQQYQYVRGEFAPFALSIARPHGRVTDEKAPIDVLVPDHPVFSTPNRIGAEDWLDWVHERGLYFAATWDEAYQPLLSLADSEREPERGALLVAPLGDGVYVYTGLSFFRQLPAGVPGAIRLFSNLLALGSPA